MCGCWMDVDFHRHHSAMFAPLISVPSKPKGNRRLRALYLRARTITPYVGWLRRHIYAVTAFLGSLVFVTLPFYDLNNMALVIATVSHFTNGGPPSTLGLWVAGPFINSMYVPGYLGYVLSGYNLYWTYTTLKIIYLGFTAILAYSLYDAFKGKDSAFAERVAIFTLINPALFFVSYVWGNYDIVPITFLTVGFVILRYHRGTSEDTLRRIALASLLICVSVFFYWFALSVLPTLVVYTRSRRERTLLVMALAVGLVMLFSFDFALLSGGLGAYLDAAIGTTQALNTTQTVGFQYFVRFGSLVYLAYLSVLAVAVPILLKAARFTEAQTSFAILTFLVFSTTFALPDNYVIIFPFAAIAVLEATRRGKSLWVLAGLLAYPFVGILLFNFYIGNAQADGVGVFYWGYDLFHANVFFVHSYSQQLAFVLLFNVCISAAVLFSVGLLLFLRLYAGQRVPSLPPRSTPGPALPGPCLTHDAHHRWRGISWTSAVVVLLACALLFNSTFPDLVQFDGHGSPPLYALTPIYWPNNGNTPRPIGNQSYSLSDNVIHFYSSAPPMAIGTWFSGQDVTLDGRIALSGQAPITASVVSGTPFAVSIQNLTQPDESLGTRVGTSLQTNITDVPLPFTLLNRTAVGYRLSGNSTLVYSLNDSLLLGHYYTFAFNITRPGYLQTNIFHIQNSENFVALVAYPYETVLVYGGQVTNGLFKEVNVPVVLPVNAWTYVIFYATSTAFWVDVGGVSDEIHVPLFGSGANEVRIGVPFVPGGANGYSLNGTVTDVFRTDGQPQLQSRFMGRVTNATTAEYVGLGTPVFTFSVTGTATMSTLSIDGQEFSSHSPLGSFYVGKLQAGSYSVNLTLTEYSVRQGGSGGLYMVPVFIAFVLPYLVMATAIWYRRSTGHHPSSAG